MTEWYHKQYMRDFNLESFENKEKEAELGKCSSSLLDYLLELELLHRTEEQNIYSMIRRAKSTYTALTKINGSFGKMQNVLIEHLSEINQAILNQDGGESDKSDIEEMFDDLQDIIDKSKGSLKQRQRMKLMNEANKINKIFKNKPMEVDPMGNGTNVHL